MAAPRSSAERQAAETVGFGGRPLRLLKWQPYQNPAGTLRGFLSIELPSGLVIRNLRLMVGPKGRRFIAMPALRQADGTWFDVVDFRDRATRDRFAEPILELLRRQHPETFE